MVVVDNATGRNHGSREVKGILNSSDLALHAPYMTHIKILGSNPPRMMAYDEGLRRIISKVQVNEFLLRFHRGESYCIT